MIYLQIQTKIHVYNMILSLKIENFRSIKEPLVLDLTTEKRLKEIETMRVWTSKSYVEKDFSSEQSKQLMKTVDCLNSN